MKKGIISVIFMSIMLAAFSQSYEEKHAKCAPVLASGMEMTEDFFLEIMKGDSCLVGADMPDFTATTIKNEFIDTKALRGKVLVLNFWFTRCAPCIEEMPAFNKLVDHYDNKKVDFISLTFDKAELVEDFLTKHEFKFKVVPDNTEVMREKFKLFSMWPYSIIIDTEGKISRMILYAPDGEVYAYYKSEIDKLLK